MKPLPASAVRLAGLVGADDSNLDDICEVIAYDQALTLSLLRAANSAAFAGTNSITQVHEAVFRLGGARVLALAVGASANRLLRHAVPSYGLSEGELWKHSVAAAVVAESLFEFATVSLPPETFTAALLHDIGKLVIGRFMDETDLELIHRAQTEGGLDPLAAERQILGVHHGELGGLVAQHWKLPNRIVKGIIYHHTPAEGLDPICDATYIANLIAKCVETSAPPPELESRALESAGVPESQVEALATAARNHFEIVSARYNTT
jgi:putative nucleotidyltransferase with HDIG domain